MRRVVLVVNSASRRARRASGTLTTRLAAAGLPVATTLTVIDPSALPDVLRSALALEPDLLVVGGGDGTQVTAAALLAHRGVALGVLPLGTTNNLARSLGVPLRLAGAVEALAAGRVVDVDLARLEHATGRETVANLVSLGVSAEVAGRTPRALKRRLGRLAYALTAARALRRHQPFTAVLRTGDTTHPTGHPTGHPTEHRYVTHQLNVANGRFHAGRPVARDATLTDQLLSAYPLGDHRRGSLVLAVVAQVLAGPRRSHRRGPFVVAGRLEISTDPPLPVDVDGEVRGRTPVTVTIDPGALRVVVPAQ